MSPTSYQAAPPRRFIISMSIDHGQIFFRPSQLLSQISQFASQRCPMGESLAMTKSALLITFILGSGLALHACSSFAQDNTAPKKASTAGQSAGTTKTGRT